MSVGIIILNYNNYEDTIRCIQSIVRVNTAPIKLIVVDNGSSREETVKALDEFLSKEFQGEYRKISDKESAQSLPKAVFVVSETNDGFAQGNNKGLKYAYSDDEIDDVLILNNDVVFTQDILPKLLETRSKIDDCGLICPLLLKSVNGEIEYNCARRETPIRQIMLMFLLHNRDFLGIISKQARDRKLLITNPELKEKEYFPIGLPSGSCMLISKSIMQEIGGFDPGTFLYYEENILNSKLKRKSLVNYCVPSVSCVHLGGASTASINGHFRWMCNFESADYFLTKFCNLSYFELLAWKIIKLTYPSK